MSDLASLSLPAPNKEVEIKGVHGLDNQDPDMHTFLLARGPDFKAGFILNSSDFMILDIFPLVSTILGIPMKPNNGSLDRALPLLSRRGLKDRKAMTAIISKACTIIFLRLQVNLTEI